MKLSTAAEPAFARHETFHPRYGWMKKAVDGALLDARLFTKDEAVVDLGVGKNMVRAIKHWGLATKVLEPLADRDHPRLPGVKVTNFGLQLLGPDGWDPYGEDAATNWLLHWKLVSPRSLAPVWWVALNEFPAVQFSIEDLRTFTRDFLSGVSEWDDPHPSSVSKDVDCFVKMYSVAEAGVRATSDELIDSPFRELGLLRATDTRRTFRFNVGRKPTLPAAVSLYACLDFLAASESGGNTITLSRLANDAGAPGRVFKLTEAALRHDLETATRRHPGVSVVESNGIPQLKLTSAATTLRDAVIRDHYTRSRQVA
jgi:hypothetical protein